MDNSTNNIPLHVAVIMDGNGRWAKARGKERIEGHYQGVKALREVIQASLDAGVKYLTVYAFSKENWGRSKEEVDGLMELFSKTISLELPSLIKQQVKVKYIGNRTSLNEEVVTSLNHSEELTSQCAKMTLCVALNYGSRSEIIEAVQSIIQKVQTGQMALSQIDNTLFSNHLYTHNIPDPDLLIRTSGEQRLSNFLLWQTAYTEFYFSETLWPDFGREEFFKALQSYSNRARRYGKA